MAEEPDNMVLVLLREIRSEQIDMRERITELSGRLSHVEAGLASVQSRLDRMDRNIDPDAPGASILSPFKTGFGLILAVVSLAAAKPAFAAGLVVAEFFTSQSCSSCPPADALLGELAQQPDVIALGCHVTYWDHLNWRDTLSLEACTQRQYGYSHALGDGPYTPQLVVGGTASLVGNQRDAVLAAMAKARQHPLAPLILALHGDTLAVALPQDLRNADLTLIRYGDPRTQAIGDGENGGRTLTYTNPVQALTKLSSPDANGTVTASLPSGPGHYAVLAAKPGSNALLAAGRLDKP